MITALIQYSGNIELNFSNFSYVYIKNHPKLSFMMRKKLINQKALNEAGLNYASFSPAELREILIESILKKPQKKYIYTGAFNTLEKEMLFTFLEQVIGYIDLNEMEEGNYVISVDRLSQFKNFVNNIVDNVINQRREKLIEDSLNQIELHKKRLEELGYMDK